MLLAVLATYGLLLAMLLGNVARLCLLIRHYVSGAIEQGHDLGWGGAVFFHGHRR